MASFLNLLPLTRGNKRGGAGCGVFFRSRLRRFLHLWSFSQRAFRLSAGYGQGIDGDVVVGLIEGRVPDEPSYLGMRRQQRYATPRFLKEGYSVWQTVLRGWQIPPRSG